MSSRSFGWIVTYSKWKPNNWGNVWNMSMWNKFFKEKCSLVLTARVLFACKLVFEESTAENQSRQFMETSNRSFHLGSRTGGPKDVDTLINTLDLLGPKSHVLLYRHQRIPGIGTYLAYAYASQSDCELYWSLENLHLKPHSSGLKWMSPDNSQTNLTLTSNSSLYQKVQFESTLIKEA